MREVFVWWLVVEIIGLAALPVAWRLFASLRDRGYAFAKPLGIFLVSFALWVLAIFGVLQNTRATAIFLVVAVAALAWWWVTRRPLAAVDAAGPASAKARRVRTGSTRAKRGRAAPATPAERPEIVQWLRANIRIIAIEEAIFLAGLLVWALFKAHNPEIVATEKPMEFAFLNGILRSPVLPPLDPWLSGYSISYYYMGYLMMAVLTRLSGLAPSIAFNLTLVLSFALTLSGAFSVVYNLAARRSGTGTLRAPAAAGLLASLFVALMGNLQGFLEFFYVRGMGSLDFWKFIGIDNMQQPYVSQTWYPTSNWWWWKASRVIGTQGAIGDYTINEFPFFSFMLGDNHPHVLALPYVLMALALALSILLGQRRDLLALARASRWGQLASVWLMPALLLGGLFFLNSWDFPTYTLIVGLAYALSMYRERGAFDAETVKQTALFILPVGLLGVLLYVPFYMNFQSQASGFGLVRVRTQLHHFLIIYAPFLFIVGGFLIATAREWRGLPAADRAPVRRIVPPLVLVTALVAVAMVSAQVWATVTSLLFSSIAGVLTSLLLLVFLAVIVFVLAAQLAAHRKGDESSLFVLLLTGVACVALLGPEWVFLNDNFGGNLSRMNTVFKFHYQGWILLALAAAYSVYRVLGDRPTTVPRSFSWLRLAYGVLAGSLVIAATFYTVMAFYTKANQFQGQATLDGMAYMKTYMADDYNAIQWLNANIRGTPVHAEAIGGSYSEYGRVATHTGLPTVQGWGGHEVQWRGNAKGWEAREGDINRLYATADVNEARNLLRKYGITHVYVGRLERELRGADGQTKVDATALGKFAVFMDVVYQQGSVTIYRVRE